MQERRNSIANALEYIFLAPRLSNSRPKRIPRSYPSLKNAPFSRYLGEKNTPLSTEIADFEVQ